MAATALSQKAIPAPAKRLRRMLEALEAHRAQRAAEQVGPPYFHIVSAAELLAVPLKPLWRERMDAAAEDGVEESLKASIREEGWRAYAVGGLDGMEKLGQQACGDSSYHSSVLDHRWDGIGIVGRGIWTA